jgi:hypothetical protein
VCGFGGNEIVGKRVAGEKDSAHKGTQITAWEVKLIRGRDGRGGRFR